MSTEPSARALGRALRLFRQERQLTLEELGAVTKLHRQYLDGLEEGRRDPSWSTVCTVARALGLDVSEVVLRAEAIQAAEDGGPSR
ncbi:MAG: helix-turn-helix domain-containing protein [Actinomycetota bacterium]|nr:helix-turn-helix domain-containing protein [Actinomycetota bacterium]